MNAGWAPEDLYGSDDDEELEYNEYDTPRDAMIFAIDASGHMLEAPAAVKRSSSPDGEPRRKKRKTSSDSSMLAALKAILVLMKRKIIVNPKDMIGIVIFNTQEDKGIGGEEFKNIHVLQDALELDAGMIKALKDLISNAEEDPTVLTDKFRPQTGPSVIAHAAATCNQILRSRSHKAATKRIYLVTDIEDPFPLTDENDDSRGRRHQAQTLAKDCAEMQYIITPFFVVHEGGSFDVTKFFADFLFHHTALDVETAKKHFVKEEEGSGHDWAHFLSVASVRPPPKRSAFSIPFILGDGLEISILGYNTVTEAKKSLAIKVDLQGESAREIMTHTTYTDADAGEPLDPKKHTRPYYQYGKTDDGQEKKIVMTEEETADLRSVGQKTGLRLLGFLDPDNIPVEHFVRHSLFIYPDEKVYNGSTRLFASLLHVMTEMDVAGLGLLVSRKNSTPQHVLILPQNEVPGDDGEQTTPPGFNLIQLAYADDIRQPPAAVLKGTRPATRNKAEAGHEDFDLAKKIMMKLRFKQGYNASTENPALHWHYAVLEAMALQEEKPEPRDNTLPKTENIHIVRSHCGGWAVFALKEAQRAGEQIVELKAMIDNNPEIDAHTGKRDAEGKVVTSKKKRVDPADLDGPSEAEVVKKAKAGVLLKFKKDEMLAYLATTDVEHKKSSAKPVLAEIIETYLKDKGLV